MFANVRLFVSETNCENYSHIFKLLESTKRTHNVNCSKLETSQVWYAIMIKYRASLNCFTIFNLLYYMQQYFGSVYSNLSRWHSWKSFPEYGSPDSDFVRKVALNFPSLVVGDLCRENSLKSLWPLNGIDVHKV